MRIPRIYTRQPLTSEITLELEASAANHVARVLRMGPGQTLSLFNGAGGEFRATITTVEKRAVTVTIGCWQENDIESPLHVELGIGISRGDRMDWILQKATELGVYRIAPLLTERTEVKLKGERAEKKQQHWEQVVISACEQCGRNRLPILNQPQKLADWLNTTQAERKFVLHHRSQPASTSTSPPSNIALAIGPEGGLSDSEITAAEGAGFEPLTLGPRILRTETAPLAALAILQANWGDMRLLL